MLQYIISRSRSLVKSLRYSISKKLIDVNTMQLDFLLSKFKIDTRDHFVNLIGIRRDSDINKFNDDLYIVRMANGVLEVRQIKKGFTTDPGKFYLENPTNSKGTAILEEGFHKDIWKLGKHQGKYKALVQANPCEVYRDDNRDLKLDKAKVDKGIFGINMHRANETITSKQVDKWSAGCQVLADPNEFKMLLGLCETAEKHGQKFFSYYLINEKDLV